MAERSIEMQFGLWTLAGPRNHVHVDVGPDRPMLKSNFRGKDMSGHARRHASITYAEMAEPMQMPFGLWTWGRGQESMH